MNKSSPDSYLLIADTILFVHVAFAAFVVLGLALILAGKVFDWSWVRNRCFRTIHALSICIVVIQAWLGVICPLTTWEMAFRSRAGDAVYSSTFISHWLQTILYYDAPPWVFVVCYTVFAALALASWVWVRPR